MILQNGLDAWRDLIAADMDTAQLGSDGTAVSLSDTGLGTAIAGTDKTVTTTTFHNGIKASFTTTAGDGSGSTAREWVLFNGEGTPISILRSAFPGISIGASTVVEIDTQVLFLQEF